MIVLLRGYIAQASCKPTKHRRDVQQLTFDSVGRFPILLFTRASLDEAKHVLELPVPRLFHPLPICRCLRLHKALRQRQPDLRKIRAAVGFEPRIPLRQTITDLRETLEQPTPALEPKNLTA